MGDGFVTLPRSKRIRDRVNVTVALEREVADLYRIGKDNGWDVSEILRQTMTDMLRRLEPTLRQNAEQVERERREAATA